MDISKDKSLLCFYLESIEAGGHEMVDGDAYEIVGEGNAAWDISISAMCGTAARRIKDLEHQLSRYSMDAGQADQRMAESNAVRKALGFSEESVHVSPRDLLDAIELLKAEALHELLMHPRESTLRKRACAMRDDLRRQAGEGAP